MSADLDMRSKVRRHRRSSLIDAVLILDGVLQRGDVDPVLHQHVGCMLKHFWIQVFLSRKDPSKLKLYSSKEEVRARVNNRVVVVVSLQNPVGALGVSRELNKELSRGIEVFLSRKDPSK